MAFRKIEAGLVHAPVDEFIGKTGTIFYDNDLGDFRISDGQTPGGIALSFGGGGNYTLPTATTTIKGGVKIDGSTITIANQVISVGTVPYSSLSGAPTIPTNTNQLTNGAAYITSSALSGYATESYVTGRGYITSSALTGLATESYVTSRGYITSAALSGYALTTAIPTNNNQLTNGAGYITSAALTGLATESYVTSRGYLTSVSWNDIQNKPNLAGTYSFGIAGDDSTIVEIASGNTVQFKGATNITVATSADGVVTITGPDLSSYATETYVTTQGYITSAALSEYALTTAIPTDISELTDTRGLLGQGGGGTTYITNNVENPYSFSIAGDDSTLREIANGESIKFTGAGGITITTDTEGNVTVTGTPVSLAGYATESYVTSRGYITGLSWDQLTDKPDIAATYSWSIAGDDSTLREITAGDSVKFAGAGGVTTTSDANGNITITAAPGIIVSATAPTDPLAKQWYNSVDGRTYVKYNDLWVDANPPVVPEVSTYLDGLVVEGTTITTVSYTDTDIKIHELTFTDNGVIQLPVGGDIVDSTGTSVLGGGGTADLGKFVFDSDGDSAFITTTDDAGASPDRYDIVLVPNGEGYASIRVPNYTNTLAGDPVRISNMYENGSVAIETNSGNFTFNSNGKLTFPNGSTIGDSDAVFGVPITTTRGSILIGNQAECIGGENHFHIMKAGQQDIDLFLGDDNNYVKLPSTGGVEISSSEIGAQHYWTFGTDGGLTFPDATVQTTAWLGVFSYNDLADKPNLAGTYSWSIAADDSTLREINTSDSVKFTGAGGVTTSSDANGNITITAAPGIIVSATAPTDTLVKQWYNSTDGRTYVKYNDLWVDANPPVVPEVSTYLDGLVVEGTTITTASYDATDIKIHNLTFTDNGVIQLPLGGDIVDSTGASVLSVGGITFEYSRLQEGITSHPITSITGLNETGLSLTSNSWAQLMWVPDITTVTLNDIDNGGNTYNWAYTESGGFIVESKYQGTIKSWRFNRNGTTDFPNYTFPSADGAANQVLKTDGNGNLTWTSATVDLTGYATETFVTSQGYITGLSWDQLTNKPNLAGTYTWSIAADDSTLREILANETVKFIGAGSITTASDAEGNITITGAAPDRLTSNARSAVLNSNGTFSLPTMTAAPTSPQAGQMALADGVSWNPMSQSGTGPYMVIYTGAAWLGLGGVTMDQVYMAILELGTAGV